MQTGITLIESIIAMALFSVIAVSLFAGISFGCVSARMAQQNLRATQILVDKIEMIRLYTWDQLNTPGYVPTTFTATDESSGSSALTTSTSKGKSSGSENTDRATGTEYSGTITISNAPLTENYSSKVKLVTVEVTWISGRIKKSRKVSAFIAMHGINTYI